MKKELPGIFKKSIDANRSNNKKVYYASERNKETKQINNNSNSSLTTVEEKIRQLFKSSRYIFNINVIIKTNKKDYDTKIAGKVKNSIVTVEGDVIPIIEINDILIRDQL